MSGDCYFISTGEPSGDILGAELVAALKGLLPGWQAHGIVGPRLRAEGVQEWAGIEDLSVMGFADVLKHFVPIKQLEDKLMIVLERLRPRFIILVDYPGFHMHLAERLRSRGIPIFQYVAPQLWAWGEKRVARLRRVTDLVLGIMPFEASFFKERGVRYTYVGTPQVDRVQNLAPEPTGFGLPKGQKVIGLFPGSRRGEVSRILPAMLEVAEHLQRLSSEVHVAVSIAPSIPIDWLVNQFPFLEKWRPALDMLGESDEAQVSPVPGITFVRGRSLQLMQRVDGALVTSGTATLECALTLTPMAVIYRTGALTYAIGKRLVKLEHISLVNLVAEKGLVVEYVQHFQVAAIAHHLLELTATPAAIAAFEDRLRELLRKLKGQPGLHAGQAICDYLKTNVAASCPPQ